MKKFPLSKNQEQFWILHKLFSENSAYNLPSIFRIGGQLNINALRIAISKLVEQHDILKTSFIEQDGSPWQVVKSNSDELFEIPLVVINIKPSGNNLPEDVLQEIHKPFELTNFPLFRVTLFKLSENDFILTIVFHHIIVDLYSKEVFFRELSLLYNSIITNSLALIERSSSQYSDFCLWQQEWLRSEAAAKMITDWSKDFIIQEELLKLPTDFSPVSKDWSSGRRKYFRLKNSISKMIKGYAKNESITPFTLLLALYSIFLNRLSGQSNIIIGVPFTNRRQEEFKNTFGCFTNIVPVQIIFSDDLKLNDLIERVRIALLKAHRRQEIPFLNLNSIIGKNAGTAFFQAGFTFEPPMQLHLNSVEVNPIIVERQGLQLEVFFTFWEENDCFNAFFEYSEEVYSGETIFSYWEIFVTIIKSALRNPEFCTKNLNIVPLKDLKLINSLNDTDCKYDKKLCIHQKFELQTKKEPDAIALITKNQSLSYNQVNEYSNRVANMLINKGVKIEDKIGICMNRSVEMIISIFGILKAGAAYLPLNPDNPTERLKIIINDARPAFIITNDDSLNNLPVESQHLYICNCLEHSHVESAANPEIKVNSKNLAYVIYTSGSTGTPKGVMVEHHSVLNRLGWMQKAYPINNTDTLLQKTPITFDVSVWELFWWSFNGSRLVILPKDGEKSPEVLIEYISDFKVTNIHFVPSMFSSFLGVIKIRKLLNRIGSLKRLFLSGEALSSKLVNDFNLERQYYSLPSLINLYGPTEATVDVSYYNCPESDVKKIFIGKPIDNTKLFVVNEKDVIQPIGIPGELIITGVNLARGYLNKDELTSKYFFCLHIPNKKLVPAYHTGDIVKLTSLGELEYLGRQDNQIKVRGFRIELGEIESKIFEHPLVDNCAVVFVEKEEQKYLVAYISLKYGNILGEDSLRSFLYSKVPDYMVPSSFIFLNNLPLSANGKLDKKKLSVMDQVIQKENIVLPTNIYENKLLLLWRFLLKIEMISIYDNFFEIGGNSLLAINLTSLIVKDFDIAVNTTSIMEYPTIKELSAFLTTGKNQVSLTKNLEIEEKTRRMKNNTLKNNRN